MEPDRRGLGRSHLRSRNMQCPIDGRDRFEGRLKSHATDAERDRHCAAGSRAACRTRHASRRQHFSRIERTGGDRRDEKTDIALLKIDTNQKLPYVTWGNSDEAKVGDWVVAVGNPFGLGGSVSAGIISALGRGT